MFVEFNLEITTGSAATQTTTDVVALVGKVARVIEEHPNRTAGLIHDTNGNTVGSWALRIGED